MTCHWTRFHTDPYNYDDAQRLLRRYTYPGDPSGFPRNLRPPPPPLLPPSQAAEGRLVCTTLTCKTQGGVRTQANQNCIEYKCKKCCTRAAREATESGQARRGCKAHGQPEVTARTTTPVHSNLTFTSSQAHPYALPPPLPSQAAIPPSTAMPYSSAVTSSQAPLNTLPQAVHDHSVTSSQAQQPLPVLPNVAARDSRSREASTYEGHSISLDVCGLSVKYVPESETAQLRAWHYESSGVTAQSRTGDCSLSCMI